MKRLYNYFIESGQTSKAEEILKIPRYEKFGSKSKEIVKSEKTKKSE